MSASSEKKRRQAAREAGTDKKIIAAQKEAAKKKKSKLKWTLGTVLVVVLIALVLFLNSGVLYTHTTAVTIGGEAFTPAEMNYHYSNQFFRWAQQYGSYASLFGLDTSAGIAGLDSQECPMMEPGSTWKDYFMQEAQREMLQTSAMLKYAAENGIELTEDEIAAVDAGFEGMDELVKMQGYGNADKFFAAQYGNGVDTEIVRQAGYDAALANKALTQVAEAMEFSDKELEDYYKSLNGEADVFDYAYYYVSAEKVESTNEAGETVSETTEETRAAAKETAEAIVEAYKSAEGEDVAEKLNAAIAETVEGAEATIRTNTAAGGLGVYKEWMMGSRKLGDITVAENNEGEGQYVVVFMGRSDNHYPMAMVRHILIQAEASEDGTYSDEAKAAAKAEAQRILKEWEDGEKTEESFAELANQYSMDPGSNTTGGLYDAVAKGMMVEEFDRFCFEGRESGDTAIVYGESGGVPGYHVMYYVGEGELYSNHIAKSDLMNQNLEQWILDITEGVEQIPRFGLRFVG